MKKITKPFDFEAFKKGAKVEMRNGNKVEKISIEYEGQGEDGNPIPRKLTAGYSEDDGDYHISTWLPDGKWYGLDRSLDLVIVEYEDEEKEEEGVKPVLHYDEVELDLTYCDNGLYYEVHYKNDDSNSDKYIVCPRNEQANKLGECLLSLVRDRMDSGLTNKVKIEMKLTPIRELK